MKQTAQFYGSGIPSPLSLAFVMVVAVGCLPPSLAKYRKKKDRASQDQSLLHPGADIQGPSPRDGTTPRAASGKRPKSSPGRQATIYATDQRTYRFLLKEGEVWNSALDVLLRNYNLTIVDAKTGIITTEWDSYYLNNAVYRNKVSMRINRLGYNVAEVTIHNNVERLRDASQAAGTVGAVWLPADDAAGEVARIIQNMALILNQPPPILPPGVEVAKDALGQDRQSKN